MSPSELDPPALDPSAPDPEWLAFRAGLKPALRLLGEPKELLEVEQRARRAGLGVERARLPDGARVALYLARDPERARALSEAEAPILPGLPPRPPDEAVRAAHAELGRLLGFPPCCVEAFLERLARGVTRRAGGGTASEAFVAAEEALARSKRRLGRLNFLLRGERLSLLPFDPCRFDCELSLRYASALFLAIEGRSPSRARRVRERLLEPVVLREGELCLRLDFEEF